MAYNLDKVAKSLREVKYSKGYKPKRPSPYDLQALAEYREYIKWRQSNGLYI